MTGTWSRLGRLTWAGGEAHVPCLCASLCMLGLYIWYCRQKFWVSVVFYHRCFLFLFALLKRSKHIPGNMFYRDLKRIKEKWKKKTTEGRSTLPCIFSSLALAQVGQYGQLLVQLALKYSYHLYLGLGRFSGIHLPHFLP